jgi:endonuclease YncB( thermonuclease family)
MKKGMMFGIGIVIVIAAVYGITQNQNTESIVDETTAKITTDTSQKSILVLGSLQDTVPNASDTLMNPLQDCSGIAKCITGIVTKIIDGDTIIVNEQSVRFSLVSAPNLEGYGGVDSRDFIQTICPVGSEVLIDEDDGHILDDHARMVGMVTCNDIILNQEILDASLGHLEVRFCHSSEFANEDWAIKHGCIKD